jgi:hypothetical protein
MENTEKIKVLFYDNRSQPIHIEKVEFEPNQQDSIRPTILNWLNKRGKGAEAFAIYKDKRWSICHSTQGNVESKDYIKHQINRIPDELLKELS